MAAVNHPRLPEHPQHDLAKRQMTGYGGLLSFRPHGGRETAERLLSALRLVRRAPSLGGYRTLAVRPAAMWAIELTDEQLEEAGVPPALIRVAVGLENTDDLVADFERALAAAGAGLTAAGARSPRPRRPGRETAGLRPPDRLAHRSIHRQNAIIRVCGLSGSAPAQPPIPPAVQVSLGEARRWVRHGGRPGWRRAEAGGRRGRAAADRAARRGADRAGGDRRSPRAAGGHRIVVVAARDRARAKEFAERHGVERVAASYAEVVADPEVDVVYNPLVNGLHGPWNLAAIAAGKHVLTEKPSAANAEEAAEVRDAAAKAGRGLHGGLPLPVPPGHPAAARAGGERRARRGAAREAVFTCPGPAPTTPAGRWSSPAARSWTSAATACTRCACSRRTLGGEPRVVAARAGERAGARVWTSGSTPTWSSRAARPATARCHMALRRARPEPPA